MSLLITFAIFSLTASFAFGQTNILEEEKKILDQILSPNRYDPKIRAYDEKNVSNPVVVAVNVYFRNIEYVCSKKMEWKVQITFRQQWHDSRLKFDDKSGTIRYINLRDETKVWTPDTFFTNSKSSESLGALSQNKLIRIYPDGKVLYSTRLGLTLSSPMDLKSYPFGSTSCPLQIASYGLTTDDLVYLWKEGNPIEVTKSLHLPQLTLRKFKTNECTSRTLTGEYSCLRTDFVFDRESSRFVSNWILPMAIITFISFVSFWLRRDKSTRIITLVVTLLLTYLHIVLISYKTPSVSYSTAIDCWSSTCLLFIFGAILEYGVVKCVDRCYKCNNKKTDLSNDCKKSNSNNCEEGDAVAMKPLVEDGHENHVEEGGKEYTVNDVNNRRNYLKKWANAPIGCKIDAIAGVVFPLLFTLYIISFFCYQTISPEINN